MRFPPAGGVGRAKRQHETPLCQDGKQTRGNRRGNGAGSEAKKADRRHSGRSPAEAVVFLHFPLFLFPLPLCPHSYSGPLGPKTGPDGLFLGVALGLRPPRTASGPTRAKTQRKAKEKVGNNGWKSRCSARTWPFTGHLLVLARPS